MAAIARADREALEAHFPQLMDSQPELLAQHYAEAGLIEKSIAYRGKAGKRSAARSAMAEAAAQFQKGWVQLTLLPDTSERPAWRGADGCDRHPRRISEALSDPEESLMRFYRYLGARLEESANRAGVFDTARRIEGAQRLQTISWDEARRGRAIVGTPETVADNLAGLRDRLGLAGILAELNTGGLIPHERVMRSDAAPMREGATALALTPAAADTSAHVSADERSTSSRLVRRESATIRIAAAVIL